MDESASELAFATPRETSRDSPPVIEFVGARLPLDHVGRAARPIDLKLCPGEMALIDAGDEAHAAMIIDVAIGLIAPQAGTARFLGRDWSDVPAVHAQAMRGRIGLALTSGLWIDRLSVLDNVLLPQLYHTHRPATEVRDEAAHLAAAFGLPGVPTGYPAELSPSDLRRASCVRAFLGRPKLVVLDQPMRGLPGGLIEPLVNALRAARDRDAAVVWLSLDQDILADRSLPADARYRLRDGALHPMSRPA
jgi:phospholipid/cholesterol/gamma-HCH transport system ATP-binding protein